MSNELKLEADTVYSIKLISGEEIVAKLVTWDDDFLYLNAPLGVGMNPNGLQLMPALFTSNQNPDAVLSRMAITLLAPSREDVEQAYTQSVTGLAVPAKKQIIHT